MRFGRMEMVPMLVRLPQEEERRRSERWRTHVRIEARGMLRCEVLRRDVAVSKLSSRWCMIMIQGRGR